MSPSSPSGSLQGPSGGRTGDDLFGHEHVTVIRPARGWHWLDPRELWAYRELILVLTARDIKVRYKQTVLGVAWAVIRPVLTMVVFSVIFGRLVGVPSGGQPYPVFVFAALLPWTFFAGALTVSSTSLLSSAELVRKVYFPRLIIPLASIGSGLLDLAISTAILLALMVFYGVAWTTHLLAAPLLLVAVIFIALGAGTLLAALTVAYRDFVPVVPFLLQIWMYVTPVIYPVELVPERFRWLLFLNPMAGLIEGFRSTFLGKPFDLPSLALSFVTAVLLFVAGVLYFERVERRFADII